MSVAKIIKNGIVSENPVFVQAIALCPLMAVTANVFGAVGMGVTTTLVLIITNISISLLRRFIPNKVRIPSMIVIIAATVSILQLFVRAFLPEVDSALGLFLPLIAVNCMIMGRGEAFAIKQNFARSAVDGFAVGIGFTIALIILAAVRELLGAGTLFSGLTLGNIDLTITLPEAFPRVIIFLLPPGAFITLGFILAGLRYLGTKPTAPSASCNTLGAV